MEGATTGMATIFSDRAVFRSRWSYSHSLGMAHKCRRSPLFGLGIAVSLILFGVKMVRGAIWGV